MDYPIEKNLYDCIQEELIELGCSVRIINGMRDHVSVLFLQNPQKSISDIIK
ncbi:transposase [Flavobacterium plurextorum]|uniref:transposase n=1 Tax=Flavobacterium plurextorum TaxID=1114867 RepID=UPI003757E900